MILLALIQQTLRELASKATVYVLTAIATVIILFFLAGLSTTVTPEGTSITFFGMAAGPPVPAEVVQQSLMLFQAASLGGLYLGLITFGIIATAGLVPDALEKGTVDLYLSKPLARWELLLGKYAGGGIAIGAVIMYFIGSLYVIFGLKTGYWNHSYLLAGFLLVYSFFVMNSLVVFVGTWTRNLAISLIVAFIYLFILGSVLEGRERGLYLISENGVYRGCIDAVYYVLPQVSAVQNTIGNLIVHRDVAWRPFVQTLASSAALFGAAAWVMRKKDF